MTHSSSPSPDTGMPVSEATAQPSAAEMPENSAEADTPKKKKRVPRQKHFWYGIAIVLALALYAIVNLTQISSFFKSVGDLLSPLVIGVVIAYLCNPFLKFYEYTVFRRMKQSGLRRSLSVTMTLITAFAIVAAVVVMMIPQLMESITDLVKNYETYLDNLIAFLNNTIHSIASKLHNYGQDEAANQVIEYIDLDKLKNSLSEMYGTSGDVLTQIMNFINAQKDMLTTSVMSIFTVLKNVIIGIFIAIYLLSSKEKRVAQTRKFRKAVFTDEQNEKINEYSELTRHCFGGFIYGKIMDSLVIGVLTFLLLTIFEVSPYNLLIATFVGLTNIIPVFGPFIGAVPSFFIVLISNPSKAILLLILILVVQQLDGNIIGPKILGDNTGVSSLSVIIAITIAGSLWGILGMLIGVPIFAVIIEVIRRILEHRLAEKGRPTDTTEYYASNALGDAEKDVYYEHAGLRYRYEHSSIKPRINRLMAKFYRRPYIPDEPETTSEESTDTNDSSET